jgi:hypothetical protein
MHHPASELNSSSQEDDFVAKDFLAEVWLRRPVLGHSILAAILLSCLYLWIMPSLNTATAIVGPAQQATSSSAVSSALSAVLPLAGLSGSGSGTATAPFDEFMQLIISPRVAALLIKEDPTILPTIFPSEWDKQTKTWHPSNSPLQLGKRALLVIFGQNSWQPPSPGRLSDYLQSHLLIAPVNTTTPMQQISFSFQSSQFAGKFLKRLLDNADTTIREEALDRTDKQIAYLQNKLQTTQPVDYRATLLTLIAQQETTRMTINKGLPFAAARIQESIVSDLPTTPSPIVTLLIGLFLGIVFGLLLTLALTVWAPGFIPQPLSTYGRRLWAKIANHTPFTGAKASSHVSS